MISEQTLVELERLSRSCDSGPWTAVVEGRDVESGDSFIQTGPDDQHGEDLYVIRDSGPAGAAYLDLIAAARTWLPELVAELRDARSATSRQPVVGTAEVRNATAAATRVILIGYWAGPDTRGEWPSPKDFVDPGWDQDQRSLVVDYLRQGQIARAYMGWSRCRLCGQNNGDLELTDGTYVWPSGLVHYVEDHGVRLPQPFVAHAEARIDGIEQAERDEDWWSNARPEPRTPDAPGDRPRPVVDDLEDLSLRIFVVGDVNLPRGLVGREHVLRAVDELGQELADGSAERWENPTLERFLDAFGALLGVIETSYTNAGRPVPLDPWVLVANALRGAREYE